MCFHSLDSFCKINYEKPPMFGKITKHSVTEQVISQIKDLLDQGKLKSGEKLPSERQMSSMLGVSRPSLREALKALVYSGILKNRVGEGMFVGDEQSIIENKLQISFMVKKYALEEFIESRRIIESATIHFSILRATKEQQENIRRIYTHSCSQLDDMAKFIKSDYAFHRAIADSSGNALLTSILQTLRSAMTTFNFEFLDSYEGRKTVLSHHEEILLALEARDEIKAQNTMTRHLEHIGYSMKSNNQ